MGTHFSKRGGHHSGVLSGHEIMAYAFLSGTQCQPKRKTFKRIAQVRDAAKKSSFFSCLALGLVAIGTFFPNMKNKVIFPLVAHPFYPLPL